MVKALDLSSNGIYVPRGFEPRCSQLDIFLRAKPFAKTTFSLRKPTAMSGVLDGIPDCFRCPVTLDVFVDPYVAPDGVTYEWSVLDEVWRRGNPNGGRPLLPSSRMTFSMCEIHPNLALKELIAAYRERTPELFRAAEAPAALPWERPTEEPRELPRELPREHLTEEFRELPDEEPWVLAAARARDVSSSRMPPVEVVVAVHPASDIFASIREVRDQLLWLSQTVAIRVFVDTPEGPTLVHLEYEWHPSLVHHQDCTRLLRAAEASFAPGGSARKILFVIAGASTDATPFADANPAIRRVVMRIARFGARRSGRSYLGQSLNLWCEMAATLRRDILGVVTSLAWNEVVQLTEREIETLVRALGRMRLNTSSDSDISAIAQHMPFLLTRLAYAMSPSVFCNLIAALAHYVCTMELAHYLKANDIPPHVFSVFFSEHNAPRPHFV